jgi:hypothetical protein
MMVGAWNAPVGLMPENRRRTGLSGCMPNEG